MQPQDFLALQTLYPKAKIGDIPNAPGVYFFYHFQNPNPVYIGKSIHLQKRIKSHFLEAKTGKKAFKITHFCDKVGIIETHGEIGALLLEAKLVKLFHPLFNRRLQRTRTLVTLGLEQNHSGFEQVSILRTPLDRFCPSDSSYGLFRNQHHAISHLESLCEQKGLCRKVLGLEPSTHKSGCFALALGQCHGACVGKVPPKWHNLVLKTALAQLQLACWPAQGPITLFETHGRTVAHRIDHWRYLDTHYADQATPLWSFAQDAFFDKDIYHILISHLDKLSEPSASAPTSAIA